jgi:LysR family pca operon transcriptional activator
MDMKNAARRLKLRQLACFLEVADRKSFARAADALNTTQPAVSKTIAELEACLGVTLLERSRRGVRLTADGETFRAHAGASMAALRQAVVSVAQSRQAEQRIAIGVLPTVAAHLMPRAIQRAKAAGLRATIVLATGGNDVLLQLLKDKKLDLVVGRFAEIGLMRELAFEHLYAEEIVVCARAGHPLAGDGKPPNDKTLNRKTVNGENSSKRKTSKGEGKRLISLAAIADYTVLLPERASIIRPAVDALLEARGLARLPDVIETTSPMFGRGYLKISDAIWIISRGVVADDLAQGDITLLPVEVDVVTGPVGVTLRADGAAAPGVELIRRALREVARA